MSLRRFTLTAVLAALSLSNTGKAAIADCNCIDNLAHQLIGQVGQLEREYAITFHGARQYLYGLNDLREISALAAHFHDAVHRNEGREHLRTDAERLDRAFHHFQSVVAEMDRTTRFGRWARGSQSFRTLMTNAGATIHQTREMVVRGCGCGCAVQPGAAVPTGYSLPTGGSWNGWTGGSSEWSGATSRPSLPALTPITPSLPTPGYAKPSLPTYRGYGRQAVPQRSSPVGSGIFFRL